MWSIMSVLSLSKLSGDGTLAQEIRKADPSGSPFLGLKPCLGFTCHENLSL